ncbi:MAG: cobalamin-dependent protein [Bacteroidales bacterium]|nr:cobalamin-dependent protein [Bacteroidales bacterium]MDD2322110.1 cobalamin-dependent protein [Bacteroidales bacterium]MDD3010184.1 cobalamin-dependent protein [Bacteroidales bacterium]MDD3961167.1 cobalamin-dependent protein [Bacteroidales bacterium]MDY0286144.1 cobalamin-dependent protein [Bacteroidales bacterium]
MDANIDRQLLVKNYLEALLKSDKQGAQEVILSLLNHGESVTDIYEHIIKPALYRVGELWESNIITVAQEHIATAITEAVMNQMLAFMITESTGNKTILLGCVENEYHQVGIKMVADLFEAQGWDTHFLGSNTPLNDLIQYAKKIDPAVFALSASIYFNLPVLLSMIEKIQNNFSDALILVGGQAFRHGGKNLLGTREKVLILHDLYEVNQFLTQST